jgi:hypothetical protein
MSEFIQPSTPNTPPELDKVEEVKTTFNCESCKIVYPLEKAIRCELCNIDEDDDSNAAENENENETEEVSVDSWDGKIKHLFCKKCTLKCDACEVRGCTECVEFAVCCDCSYNMCIECRNNEVDCGCYGECYTCGSDVNRGSDGWPCNECDKWYCRYCRYTGENTCDDCNPNDESDNNNNESDNEESNNETPNNETPNNETPNNETPNNKTPNNE